MSDRGQRNGGELVYMRNLSHPIRKDYESKRRDERLSMKPNADVGAEILDWRLAWQIGWMR
jgi:hypothetical protein